jgi:hypothetical protein
MGVRGLSGRWCGLGLLALTMAVGQACGSDSQRRAARGEEGGAGGEAGQPNPSQGGSGTTAEGGSAPIEAGASGDGGAGTAGSGDEPGVAGQGSPDTGGQPGTAGMPATGAGGDETGGLLCPVLDESRIHYMLGRVQNPQTITFGAGEVRERTFTLSNAVYLAAFDRAGCFSWVGLMRSESVVIGAGPLQQDAAGNLYTLLGLTAGLTLENPDGSVAASFTAAGTGVSLYRRGVLILKYSPTGELLYAKRFGNAAVQPDARTYSASSLTLRGNTLRASGSTLVGNLPNATQDFIVGEGEAGETVRTLDQRLDFAFTASFDSATGNMQAGSLRLATPNATTGANEIRHSAVGSGGMATDGRYVQVVLVDDPATYLLNTGETDQTSFIAPAAFSGRIVGYTAAGAIAWQRRIADPAGGMGFGTMSVAADGSSITSGSGPDAGVTFDDGAGGTTTVPGPYFWVHYDDDGNLIWARGNSVGSGSFYLDEAQGDLYVLGAGAGAVSFGVGEPDQFDVDLGTRSGYLAKVDAATGAIDWLVRVEASGSQSPFRAVQRIGNELVVSTRFDNIGILDPGSANPIMVGTVLRIWSGSVRYDTSGAFLGYTPYVTHGGTALNDGLNAGLVAEP